MNPSPPVANLIVLRSSDIHRAATFYRALGLALTIERHGGGPEHYSSSAGGFVFEIYPLAAGRTPTSNVRVGFGVATVDDLLPPLLAAGAGVLTEPHDSEWGRRAVIRDPDGHAVELVAVAWRER